MLRRIRAFSSIKSRLALLVAVCILPASLMAMVLLSYDYFRERKELRDNAVITARTIASVVDQQFSGIDATLRALATSPALARRDLKTFYQQALAILPSQPVQGVFLTTPGGQELVNTLRPFGARLPRIVEPSLLRLLANSGGPVISNLLRGPITQRPQISICVPVRSNEKQLYNLCAIVVPQTLSQLLRQQQLPPDWIVAVLDSAGNIIARSHEMERYLGSPASRDLRDALAFDNEGWFEGKTSEGIPVLAAFSRSAVSNWSIAIGIRSRSIARRVEQKIAWLAAAILLLLGVSGWAAQLVGRGISQAVRGLVGPALALGHGEQVTIPRLHLLEADEVAGAIRQASTMLRDAEYQASHDALTGLPNRAFFNEFVNKQLALSSRSKTPFSILYIDLDGFKPVNDVHGHAAGDAVLSEVARRLRGNLRESDVAARLGGDEFAVILVGAISDVARRIANKLIHILSAPYDLAETTVRISASIGIAGHDDAVRQGVSILQLADTAMYLAKAAGKGRSMSASGEEQQR